MIANRTSVGVAKESGDAPTSTMVWTGRVLSGLVVIFLFGDAIGKILKLDPSVEGTVDLGYPESVVFWIGLTLFVSTVLYAIPRTAFFGAILLTGFLGGASATNVRLEDPWFMFPVAIGIVAWVGLALRDNQLRELAARTWTAGAAT